jgi:hypothetical protein
VNLKYCDYQIDRLSFVEHGLFSATLLLVIFGMCFLQEYLARRAGMGVRKNQFTVPFAIIPIILGVYSLWIIVYLGVSPFKFLH